MTAADAAVALNASADAHAKTVSSFMIISIVVLLEATLQRSASGTVHAATESAPVSFAARSSGSALDPSWERAMATVIPASRAKPWKFSNKPPYGWGACVGRGSVIGDGAGVTVCTDGPALVSPTRSAGPR